VIRDPPLGKVVGADTIRAIAGADQVAPQGRLLARLLLLGAAVELGLQQGQGAGAVLVLRALVLALDDDTRGQVRDAHGGVGLVDVLATGAGGAERIDAQVRLADLHGLQLLRLGRMATVQAEVWMRPWDSVSGTRCTRCAPDSNFRRAYTSDPRRGR
jgi:hypothetical protein